MSLHIVGAIEEDYQLVSVIIGFIGFHYLEGEGEGLKM